MNRYRESNLVYGITNGLKLDWLEKLDEGLPKSDLVIVLDVPQKESFARKKQNRDKFEKNLKIMLIHTGGLQGIEGFNRKKGNIIQ